MPGPLRFAGNLDSKNIDAIPKRSLKDAPKEDLKQIMDGAKNINREKDSLRNVNGPVNPQSGAGQPEIDRTKKGK
jgi:hypothetical protein